MLRYQNRGNEIQLGRRCWSLIAKITVRSAFTSTIRIPISLTALIHSQRRRSVERIADFRFRKVPLIFRKLKVHFWNLLPTFNWFYGDRKRWREVKYRYVDAYTGWVFQVWDDGEIRNWLNWICNPLHIEQAFYLKTIRCDITPKIVPSHLD